AVSTSGGGRGPGHPVASARSLAAPVARRPAPMESQVRPAHSAVRAPDWVQPVAMDTRELRGPELLAAYGWDAVFAERFAPFAEQGLLPARVVVEYQHIYRVVGVLPERIADVNGPDGEMLATVAGRLRHRAAGRLDYPVVGDWVAIR